MAGMGWGVKASWARGTGGGVLGLASAGVGGGTLRRACGSGGGELVRGTGAGGGTEASFMLGGGVLGLVEAFFAGGGALDLVFAVVAGRIPEDVLADGGALGRAPAAAFGGALDGRAPGFGTDRRAGGRLVGGLLGGAGGR